MVTVVVGQNQTRNPQHESTKMLARLHKFGANIYECTKLHARVIVAEAARTSADSTATDQVMITSASLNRFYLRTAAHENHDAGVVLDEEQSVRKTLAFVNHVIQDSRPWVPDNDMV